MKRTARATGIPGSIPLDQARPGDIVVFETGGIFGALIGFGEWLRRLRYHDVHHVGVVTTKAPDGSRLAIQAARHVDEQPIEAIAKGRPFYVLPCPAGVNRRLVVAQARAMLGCAYGVASIISIAFQILTPGFFHIELRRQRTIICSALGALCLHAGGFLHPWDDIYEVMPAELAAVLADPPR